MSTCNLVRNTRKRGYLRLCRNRRFCKVEKVRGSMFFRLPIRRVSLFRNSPSSKHRQNSPLILWRKMIEKTRKSFFFHLNPENSGGFFRLHLREKIKERNSSIGCLRKSGLWLSPLSRFQRYLHCSRHLLPPGFAQLQGSSETLSRSLRGTEIRLTFPTWGKRASQQVVETINNIFKLKVFILSPSPCWKTLVLQAGSVSSEIGSFLGPRENSDEYLQFGTKH
jgi:hypothetical protein